jgi:hypothetical protein
MSASLAAILGLALSGLLLAGCGGAPGWQPPPPSGVTYVYDYQGFRERGTTAFGGVVPVAPNAGVAYGGAFSFREGREIRGEGWKDPFAESTPLDGVRFNEHLGGRGVALAPRVAGPSAPASSAGR